MYRVRRAWTAGLHPLIRPGAAGCVLIESRLAPKSTLGLFHGLETNFNRSDSEREN